MAWKVLSTLKNQQELKQSSANTQTVALISHSTGYDDERKIYAGMNVLT
jgi:hypothetical protein